MRSWRTLGVVAVVALAGALMVMPGAGAQVVTPVTVRTTDGTLHLHMGAATPDGAFTDYFRFDTPSTTGPQQQITGVCPNPVNGPTGPAALANLTGGRVGSSFSINQVGLKSHTLGIKYLNCGAVDATNWELRMSLGTAIGIDANTAADYADLDLRGSSSTAVAVVTFLRAGTVVATREVTMGPTKAARLTFGNLSDPTGSNLLFDEIRLRPKKVLTSVSLGGGSGSTNATDSIFRVVSETQFEAGLCPGGDPLTTNEAFPATVSRLGESDPTCADPAPVSLDTSIDDSGDAVATLTKGAAANDVPLTMHVDWPDATAPSPGITPATLVDYGTDAHPIQWCEADSGGFPTLPDRIDAGHVGEPEFWCLTDQETHHNSNGTTRTSESYFGFGDPKFIRGGNS